VFAELKGPATAAFVDAVCTEISRAGLTGRVCLISMDWAALEHARAAHHPMSVGFIAETPGRMDEAFRLAGQRPGDLVDPDHRLLALRPDLAARATEAGTEMAVWTVDTDLEAMRMADLGVGALTTNRVKDLLRWRGKG